MVYLGMGLSDFRTAKLTYLFNLLDLDKDGLLTENDFEMLSERASESQDRSTKGELRRRLINSSAKRYFKRLLEALIIKKTVISQDDWLQYHLNVDSYDHVESDSLIQFFLEFFFGVFDENKDGYISIYESMELFRLLGISQADSKMAFKSFDTNSDGHISRYELMDAVDVFFTSENPEEEGNWVFGRFQ